MSVHNFHNWRQRFWQRLSSKPKAISNNSSSNYGEVPMSRRFKGPCWLTIPALLLAVFASKSFYPDAVAAAPGQTPGSLQILGKDGAIAGACPLKHTDVRGA